jgi:hypothetical protein
VQIATQLHDSAAVEAEEPAPPRSES